MAHCGERNYPVVGRVEERPRGVPGTALSVPNDEEEEGEEERNYGEHGHELLAHPPVAPAPSLRNHTLAVEVCPFEDIGQGQCKRCGLLRHKWRFAYYCEAWYCTSVFEQEPSSFQQASNTFVACQTAGYCRSCRARKQLRR